MTNKSMGDIISTLRKEKGMTQKDLADMLNITDKAVSSGKEILLFLIQQHYPKLQRSLAYPWKNL